MINLQVCVVMFVYCQEGLMLRICYGAHAAVIWYSLWAGAFGSTNHGSRLGRIRCLEQIPFLAL